MNVTRADLETFLADIEAANRDRQAGVFGPGSPMWEVSKESVIFLGGGRAAFLQLAHPWVAQAIAHHSHTKSDLAGRFQRTFMHVFSLVFGDLDAALATARRVHNIHRRVHGRLDEAVGPWEAGAAYDANDADALLWVHATLTDTSVQVYELVLRPLSDEEKEAFYQDSRLFARLFGVPDDVLPRTWRDFRAYMDRTLASGAITVSRAAAEMGGFLLTPPRRALTPVWGVYGVMTAGLLPPHIREQYGLRFGPAERALFWSTVQTLRRSYPRAPRRLRYLPAYVEARRRLKGVRGRDWYGDLVHRVVMGALKQRGDATA